MPIGSFFTQNKYDYWSNILRINYSHVETQAFNLHLHNTTWRWHATSAKVARPLTPSAKMFSSPLFLFASWSIRCPKSRRPRSIMCTFNCVYIMLAVDDQMTLLSITGHNIRGWHWMGMCESVSDSPESLCNTECFAIPGRDGPVILEQRHRSCLLTRVKTPVKQSKLIEKPATTNNEWMTWTTQPGHAAG